MILKFGENGDRWKIDVNSGDPSPRLSEENYLNMWWSRNKSKTGLDDEEGSVTKFSGPFYYPSPKTRWFGPSKTFLRALLVLFHVTIEACSSLELQEPHALLLQLRRMCFMIQEVVCRFSNCCCARSWKMKSVESSLPPAVLELTHCKVFQRFAILYSSHKLHMSHAHPLVPVAIDWQKAWKGCVSCRC
jgi:hypothetical protein